MGQFVEVASWASRAVTVTLFVLVFLQWRRQRGRPAAWAAAAFGIVALVTVGGIVARGNEALQWVFKPLLVLLALFPYFLFRFMAALVRPRRRLEVAAFSLTGLIVASTFFLPDARSQGAAWLSAYAAGFALQWLLLSLIVAWKLWAAGRGQPTVTRRRMRLLGSAAGMLCLAVVLSIVARAAPGDAMRAVRLGTYFFAAIAFYLGLVPPRHLRMSWRRDEEASLRAAARELMGATTVREVTRAILSRAAPAFGGSGAFIADRSGRLVDRHGLNEEEGRWLASGLRDGQGVRIEPGLMVVPIESGWIGILASPFAPFFQQDELSLLQDLGALADLALQRAELFDRERRNQAQLNDAQRLAHVGSFQWEVRRDHLTWSDELSRIYGFEPGHGPSTIGAFLTLLHPDDREAVQATVEDALAQGRSFEMEERILRPDGDVRVLASRGEVLTGEDGAPLHVLGVCQDITERKRAEAALELNEEELRVARDKALEASRLKSQFLANMSHEIRTPMNGVVGMAHLLLDTELDETQRRYLLALLDSGENLLTLLNDILDLSKIEAGRLELEETTFDLSAVVRGVVDLFACAAAEKGLDIDAPGVTDTSLWVRGDPGRLRQILANLVGNAVKFTDRGSIRVSLRPAGPQRFRFEVADTGIGIDPPARAAILDPFTQGDASTTRRFGGTGLGLAICRQLIDVMGGTLDFESTPGAGATFWFEIPFTPAVPGTQPPPPATWAEPVGRGRTMLLGCRVLLVEDSPVNQLVARGMLERAGCLVDVAANGSEALDAVMAAPYDAVLMDCLMPVMDGYEATRRIRLLDGPAGRIPIVAVTASAGAEDRDRCLAAGMDDRVTKPLDPAALTRALVNCLTQRAATEPGAPPPHPVALEAAAPASAREA